MKKFLLTLLAAAALLTALPVYAAPQGAAAASEPEALTVGMPNPYVAYETLPEMKAVLGFDPLFVPRSAGYECTKMYIIGGTIADIRFTGIKDNARSTCGVRSGRIDIAGMDDISGYYSVPWEDVHISQTDLHSAQLDYESFVANWTHGKYAFPFNANAISSDRFREILTQLVQTTERNYKD